MHIRVEIDRYSAPDDKPVLQWLFDRYHMASQWQFVATCEHDRYGKASHQTNRRWIPTKEGRVIYGQFRGDVS